MSSRRFVGCRDADDRGDLDRLCEHVHRHVHGDPRRAGRGDLAADNPERARNPARPDELGADRLSHRRGHRDSADRLPHPHAEHALAVRAVHRRVHPGVSGLRRERQFHRADCLAVHPGVFRRHADPGGVLGGVPAVSSARQGIATTFAGVLAVLAPTVGPIVGGWITETYSWHWLFLINVIPGIVAASLAGVLLPKAPLCLREARTLDIASLALLTIALAALEIALKEAPQRGWTSGVVGLLLALSVASVAGFIWRTLCARHPIVDLRSFADRRFSIGCVLSFVLGIGLFGSVYLMPVFLAFVRHHDALEIGETMLVTGVAQLAMAPIAVALERRLDARMLTAAGFLVFAVGLGLSAVQTRQTDYDGMFWPQVIRGVAIMFCLLPPTRLALGHLDKMRVPDASGLFNLMRNLGGAIGLALIDTVIYGRSPLLGVEITKKLQAGDVDTAKFIGIPVEMFVARPVGPLDGPTQALVKSLVERAALAQAINEAWIMIAVFTIAALLWVPFAERSLHTRRSARNAP